MANSNSNFDIIEATVASIHAAYADGSLSARQLVQAYLDRIASLDQQGPKLNAIISLNKNALAEGEALDKLYKTSGPAGPLHAIPVIIKDQADVAGLPTTLGSVLFKEHYPDRDCFVVERLKRAGAIILGKATAAAILAAGG